MINNMQIIGFYVGNRWMAKSRDLFPKNMKYPENKVFGIEGEMANEKYCILPKKLKFTACTSKI